VKTEAVFSPLPFFFREIESLDQYIMTNISGSHAFVDSLDKLNDIINGNSSRIKPALQEELRAKSFVASGDEYPMRVSMIGSKFASILNSNIVAPNLFLVVPTLRCDHNCHYCQVSRAPISMTGVDLQAESINKILDIIQAIPNSDIKIEFQGGEPLLAFSYIQEFIVKGNPSALVQQLLKHGSQLDATDITFRWWYCA